MKKYLYVIALVLLASCSSKQSKESKQKALPPETEITGDNAGQVTSFDNTPESVVMYFYASRIRKDNDWEKVCQPADQQSDKMKRKLNEYSKWTFTKYKYVSKKEFEPNKFWVTLHMAITVEGESDEGEDEATVEMIDGKWVVTEVPT
jgi:hypothetical protein